MSTAQTLRLPSQKRRALLDKATTEYAECVDLARTYLRERGLTDEVIDRWQLGYVLDPITGHERFKGYLSIPYVTRAGTVAMKFRCIKCEGSCVGHPKYDSEKGTGTFLYGAPDLMVDSSVICVTEGEIDKLSCNVAGLPAVGIPGGTKWQQHWAYCFEGFEEVIALQDGFKEGDKARDKFSSNVSANVHNSRIVEFEPGEDVNSYLVKHGPEALRERVLGRG